MYERYEWPPAVMAATSLEEDRPGGLVAVVDAIAKMK